jgi:DNA-binding NarL/FixJ family response regulator
MEILIADDSTVFRTVMRRTLEGVECVDGIDEAVNGEDAIRKVEENHPDLVLMDISMPGMDGLSAARIIKQDHPKTKLVILSQHEGPYVADAIKLLGLEGFVSKSEAGENLINAIMSMDNRAS